MKKIAVVYPPFTKDGLYPLITQNRQFRFAHSPKVKIYPLVAASLATILLQNGNEVLFLDGVTKRMSMNDFLKRLSIFMPEYIFLEIKAPLIPFIKEFIEKVSKLNAKTIIFGDHAAAFPEETLLLTDADYAICSGDYDHSGSELIKSLKNGINLPKGCFKKESGDIIEGNRDITLRKLDDLPMINRDMTDHSIYEEAYLYHPCAYILSGRGCGTRSGAGKCTFCLWQHSLWKRTNRLHSPQRVSEEIEILVRKYGVVEIFDDNESGALWNYQWLEEFYSELERRKLLKRFYLSSNARADALDEKTCILAKKIGYRLLKVGVESGNDKFLKLIGKEENVEMIRNNIKTAKKSGLRIMLTLMSGFPDETEKEIKNTYELAKELMLYRTRFGDCLQASILVPYPGTPLYTYLKNNDLFLSNTENYNDYMMEKSIIRTKIDANYWCNKMWKLHLNPIFILRSLFGIRNIHDVKTAFNGILSLPGHLKDFKK